MCKHIWRFLSSAVFDFQTGRSLPQPAKPACALGLKSAAAFQLTVGTPDQAAEPCFWASEIFEKPNTAPLFQKPPYVLAYFMDGISQFFNNK
jgi:hypothetical protein